MKRWAVEIGLGGQKIRVSTENRTFAAVLREAFSGAREGRKGRPGDLEIRWRDGTGELWGSGRRLLRSRRAHELLLWTEWAAAREAIARLRDEGSLLLHAAWLARGRDGLLLAGPHESGKTSLAVALSARRGWRVRADDVVVVDRAGGLEAVERPARVKAGTRDLRRDLAALGADARPWRQGLPLLVPLAALGGRGGSGSNLRAIVVLVRGRRGLRVTPLTHGLSLAKLALFLSGFREGAPGSLRALAALAARARSYEFAGGTLAERCRQIERIVS